MRNIEKVKAFFARDNYLAMTGVSIDEVGDDCAVCSLEIADIHLNAAGVIQGGAVYTLADSAFAVASNAGFLDRDEKKLAVNQSATISYFRPPKGGKLIVSAKKIDGGNRVSVYRMEVSDESGTAVALMIGNAYAVELGKP
ncbi:MAG: PaaI family thioesterase [Clostridiales Family XIII bacterium]|nr:PaaI family thioesterase [Clostridiales Family XIII bacterium]